ncbi:MAG: hypothetical protein COB53_06325 [Elusimicrobia bacterium]|nr:MAG: hypothetical protein COB53_06325 [Elusimicrobiota bacterium]
MNNEAVKFITLATIAHAALTLLSLLSILLVVTPGFGIGAAPPTGAMLVIALSFVLRMPVMVPLMLMGIEFPGSWGFIPILLNSSVWAVAAWLLFHRRRQPSRFP